MIKVNVDKSRHAPSVKREEKLIGSNNDDASLSAIELSIAALWERKAMLAEKFTYEIVSSILKYCLAAHGAIGLGCLGALNQSAGKFTPQFYALILWHQSLDSPSW